jgi:hypothetical protein
MAETNEKYGNIEENDINREEKFRNENNINTLRNSDIIGNEEFTTSLNKLSLLKKEHKYLNNQLHIFSHKIKYNIQPLRNKKISDNTKEFSLPQIQNKNISGEKKVEDAFINYKTTSSVPKFNYVDEKLKIQKSKQILEENKKMRIKKAKDVKEANRLMKENVLILKEKIKEENKQKKKIVDIRYEFIKNSISNFKMLKQEYIKGIITNEMEKEMKEIQEKLKQLNSLKELNQKNLKRKNINTSEETEKMLTYDFSFKEHERVNKISESEHNSEDRTNEENLNSNEGQ